jgi:ABC-type oligopeptide transport system substrate-binding subunit
MRKRSLSTLVIAVLGISLVLGACSTGTKTGGTNQAARPAFVEKLRLPGGDYGYPTPFAANPRGPGTVNVNFVFDTLLWKDSTGMGGDPDSLRTRLASNIQANSFTRIRGYNNPAFDEAANRQLLATTDADRKAAVQEMQRIVADDVPLISLYVPNRVQVFNKSLFDAWYYTPGGVFGGYPGVLNKHVFVTGKQSGF